MLLPWALMRSGRATHTVPLEEREMKTRLLAVVTALLFASALHAQPAPKRAQAHLVNAEGKSIGTATLVPMGGGVHITATLSHLPPGTHAFHIHAVGKCEAPGF